MEYKRLIQRMYFFVPYNLSPIQQAIQAGHAALEYAVKYFKEKDFENFMFYDKTWIILNGGTTNDGHWGNFPGSMQEIRKQLRENRIAHEVFNEPDLNEALTAICFLADERVWDYENYPDFVDFIMNVKMTVQAKEATPTENYVMLKSQTLEHLQEMFPEYYEDWITFLGGEKNLFLRNLIKNKKLA
jgi:hypothetical protein